MPVLHCVCVWVGQWFKTLNYFTHVREDVHEEFSKNIIDIYSFKSLVQ